MSGAIYQSADLCEAAPGLTLVATPSMVARLKPRAAAIEGLVLTSTLPKGLTYWRFETEGAMPIELPGTAIWAWERPPFSLSVRLVPSVPGQSPVQEAVIGTRLGLAELEEKLIATMVILLRAARDSHARSAMSVVAHRGPKPSQKGPAGLISGLLRHAIHRMQDWVLVDEWAVGIVRQPVEALLRGEPLQPVRWLSRGPGINLADPHPKIGSDRILCEEFGAGSGVGSARGRIICLELDRCETAIASYRVILAGDMHRSYPGSIRVSKDVVFLPETPARGATELFRLQDDDTVERVCSIGLSLRMADPTLFEHGGRFWIAYTDLDIGEHDNLCLLHAPALAGPWIPHLANPVKIDVRSSRPAGPVIATSGRLYRPAQNCAASYGASIAINRIEDLTPERFSEVVVREITPSPMGPYPHGLHTIASRDKSVLIDGKRRVFRSRVIMGKARGRLRPFMAAERATQAPGRAAA